MIVANPIYDVVFKFLMEDTDIAKGLISAIIGEEITELSFQPQEVIVQSSETQEVIRILRLDFKAVIKLKNGTSKITLIELQKAKKLFDVMRFRQYLGENYKKGEETTNTEGIKEIQPLPIVTIYFLGFTLEHITIPALKVDRIYINAATGEPLDASITELFVEQLTHDSFTIQIPRLNEASKEPLERILRVFNQKYVTKDKHQLNLAELKEDDPLVQKILNRLTRAIASEEVRLQMEAEDEIERLFGKVEKKLENAVKELEESKKELGLKDKELEEKDKELEEKGKELTNSKIAMENLQKQLEELQKQLKN